MNALLIINCGTPARAKKVYKQLFILNKAYNTEKELDRRGFEYKFYPVDTDLRDLNIDESTVLYVVKDLTHQLAKNDSVNKKDIDKAEEVNKGTKANKAETIIFDKAEEVNKGTKANKAETIIFDKGMSINKFLKQNPCVRTVDELSKYYGMDVINKAHKHGVFEIQRGKIKF